MKRAYGFGGARNARYLMPVPDIMTRDGGQPFGFNKGGREARPERLPYIVHMHAAKCLIRQVRYINTEYPGARDQGAMVQGLAIHQRAINVPGNGAHYHGRPARRP